MVCGRSAPSLWWCHSSICKRQKNPGAETASGSGSYYNPSKYSWFLQIIQRFSAQPTAWGFMAPLASGNIPVKFHFYPCACLFLNWQYFQMFTQGKAHHAGLFRQPSNCIKHLLLLQKQEARCPQVWLFFSLILVELPQCYDYPEGWCSSGSWMYSSSETRRGYTFISISSWRGELFMLSFTLIMDWSCK